MPRRPGQWPAVGIQWARMAKTARDIVRAASEIRRAFAQKLRALDARRAEIAGTTVRAAEEKKINELRARYE